MSLDFDKKCCGGGPGYATPMDAVRKGPREKLLYVITVQPDLTEPHGDYLSTVDVDPDSPTYCQVIHRTFTNRIGNELHHSGWNACSSCFNVDRAELKSSPKRNRLILPCLNSDRIYVIDTETDPLKPEIVKEIDSSVLKSLDLTAPHTTHCLANGDIMISTMGNSRGRAKGEFVTFNSNFECLGTWTRSEQKAMCGYDFWYQPYFDIMVASEWGAPNLFRRGWKDSDLKDITQYGRRLNFYQWSTQKLLQCLDLGVEGTTPLEVRFLHNPRQPQGFVGTTLYSKVFRFFKKTSDTDSLEYTAEKVIDCKTKRVKYPDGRIENINGMMTDILLSLDDRFLYFSNWMHGDVRQYDITDPHQPVLTGRIFLGGVLLNDTGITLLGNDELKVLPPPCIIKGRRLQGGPQMLQLSLDGKRLYCSSSLFSPWDKQFYPEMVKAGGTIVQIDCDTVNGGMMLNRDFLVDFNGKNEPYGPALPHEMRYPGGDCTSDIWLADE